MPRLGVCVMAHPKRAAYVDQLAQKVYADKPIAIAWDEHNIEWDTGRRAWLKFWSTRSDLDGLTHWLVIQDDALVCRDLVAGVEEALRYIPPRSPLSLYIGTRRPHREEVNHLVQKARAYPTSFIVTNRVNWGVALVVPTAQISPMIDYADKRGDPQYDRRLGKYFLENRIPVYHTWPSLVDHRNSASLLGNMREDRHAHEFIGENKSALSARWDLGVVHAVSSATTRHP